MADARDGGTLRTRIMRLVHSLTALAFACTTAACSQQLPPRPVPPPEAKPALPPWYPEQPWNSDAQVAKDYFFGKIVFDTAKATIRPESEQTLQKLLEYLKANGEISRVRLEGHTDARAGEEYNQKLSERRAIAVADWLTDHGLDHNRILAVAFGETRPIGPNETAEGRQENRRTEFHVAEVQGRRFQGKDPSAGGLVLSVLSKDEREAQKRQGDVPTYEPPPFEPEGDVFKPYPKDKQPARDAQTRDLLRDEETTVVPADRDDGSGSPDVKVPEG